MNWNDQTRDLKAPNLIMDTVCDLADERDDCGTALPNMVPARGIAQPAPAEANTIRVGLIDCYLFTRDCLIRAFAAAQRDITVVPFRSVREFLASDPQDIDVILYYSHEEGPFEALSFREVITMREAFAGVPIVVLSDATTALESRTIKNALKMGVRGFIPTRTIEMPAVSAAIRFVKAGGTFAPVELLLAGGSERATVRSEAPPAGRLTSRQMTVLSHLRQGKANKIIAYELGMSESTVKVHIRNIMRKMGATNRTQAVYKSQQLPSSAG